MIFVVVSYDIQSNNRRSKVFKTLKNYGQWMQYSVFECQNISKEQFLHLRHKLEKEINKDEDSVRFYILCGDCEDKVIRIGGINLRDESVFFV